MLYFIGLGLGDAKDITVRGLEIVKRCEKVFLEHYTSILTVGQEELEKFYEREVNIKFGKKTFVIFCITFVKYINSLYLFPY